MNSNNDKPWKGGESYFRDCHIVLFKIYDYQQKNDVTCKETGKYGPYTGDKEVNRSYPFGSPTVELTRQRL